LAPQCPLMEAKPTLFGGAIASAFDQTATSNLINAEAG
jgi:hypothetical protein